MDVNPTKEKKLSNMRAVGHDRNILLKPARRMSLEEALEFIAEDEWVEVTPQKSACGRSSSKRPTAAERIGKRHHRFPDRPRSASRPTPHCCPFGYNSLDAQDL